MASTHKVIATYTLASTSTSIDFTSIPSTYTDLKLVVSGRLASADNYFNLKINGSAISWNVRTLRGGGSGTPASETWSSAYAGIAERSDATASFFGSTEYYILNYANTSVKKSMLVDSVTENTITGTYIEYVGAYWDSTTAISSISLTNITPASGLAANTTATLYGINKS